MLARSVMCALLCGTRLFQQTMRQTLVMLLLYIAAEMRAGGGELTQTQQGNLKAAIAAGYFFTQVPGGALAEEFGAKNVMGIALLCSALCCLAAPVAFDACGVGGMWITIAIMGGVQGPLFPTSSVFLAKWMPKAKPGEPDEKAWGTSMLDIGISLGSLVVPVLVTFLAEQTGWRNTYRIVGLASIGFVCLWQAVSAETPGECWFISDDEKAYLKENIASKPKSSNGKDGEKATPSEPGTSLIGMPYQVACHSGLWAVFGAHIAFNFGGYYLTNNSPAYYCDEKVGVLGLTQKEAVIHLTMPHVSNLAAKSLNPILASFLARRGYTLLEQRKAFTCFGFIAAALALLPVYSLRFYGPWPTTILCSAVNAFFGMAPTGFKSNYLDITEKYTGIISGYGNTLGTCSSYVQPILLSYILATAPAEFRWPLVLAVVVGMNLVAALGYHLHATVTPIERLVADKAAKKTD